MGHDYLTYRALDDDRRNSNKVAWVIGIVLAFVVIAIIWASMRSEQTTANNRAIDAAVNISNRVGILEGNQVVTGEILRTTTTNLSAVMQEAAANATNVAAQGRVLDELAVITANTGGSCTSSGSGIPRFRRTNRYSLCDSTLLENDVCGQA